MTARTPATLKTNMPVGVTGGTTIPDMHDFIDMVSARTTFSVKEYGADGTIDNPSTATNDTAAFVAATAAAAATANGAGCVYVPAGVYHITPNTWAIPSKVKVLGDGYGSKIRKNGSGWLLDISGTGNWAAGTQTRNSYCIVRDLAFDGKDNPGDLIRTIYASEVLIDKCRFSFNSGPAINATEWWDSRVNNCFFDWCGSTTLPVIYMRNSSNATVDALGYSEDSTNAIYFYGCRWESFKNGAIWLERGPVADNSSLSQVFMTNCKFETHYLAGPLIWFDTNATVANIHIDTLFISVNAFNTGYTPPAGGVDLIQWNVNNCCSLRNIWCYIANSTLARVLINASVSFNNCTIENIFVSGSRPSAAMIEVNSTTEPRMIGIVGGSTNAMYATVTSKGNGQSRALTALRAASLLDDGVMFTNNTGADIVVELSRNAHPGWKCSALQLSALGTITFQQFSVATDTARADGRVLRGATFVFENGTDHRRTNGQYAMIYVRCISNNTAMDAAVYHISGKTTGPVTAT